MSDQTQINMQIEICFLDEKQDKTQYAMLVSDVTITVPVDSHEWDRLSSDDRDELIQSELWERCRTYWRQNEPANLD